MQNSDPQLCISEYEHQMYENSQPENRLRTGDVVKLDLDDFQSIARHNSILDIFKDFKNNHDYNNMLWAVLNKSCDMIHDFNNRRSFKNNLFLIPLQGLMSTWRKETIRDILHHQGPKEVSSILTKAYKQYLSEKTKNELSQKNGEDTKSYGQRIQTYIKPAMDAIKESISEGIAGHNHPPILLEALKKNFFKNEVISSDLTNFEKSNAWQEALRTFNEQQKEYQNKNSKIVLKSGAAQRIAQLTLNQLDSQGIFYYEPHKDLSDLNYDISYLIQFEDMITLKVKKEMQDSGNLVSLLIKKRCVSLTRNFSDRLLNMMGTYFSKIGTPDVMADRVLSLYKDIYPNNFFLSVQEYDENKEEIPS